MYCFNLSSIPPAFFDCKENHLRPILSNLLFKIRVFLFLYPYFKDYIFRELLI